MSLVELWRTTPAQVSEKHVQQVIVFAGSGRLRDGNETSQEFRSFLAQIPSTSLSRYATECLESKFDDSGLALQDVVNEAGRRLGFAVRDGRYRGTQADIGFDGLWSSGEGDRIVVEVKTTDAYRIDLDTIAEYRRALIRNGEITEERSSILIVVGRQDTGDLEAQIRGSRHAWDVRLLSIESLFRLVSIREEIEGPQIARKICDLLIPREYTKVDGIIDLVFATAAEVKGEELDEAEEAEATAAELRLRSRERKPKFVPVNFHGACADRISTKLGVSLVKRSMATFSSADGDTALICAVSREHPTSSGTFYWYAFHPHQRELLKAAPNSFISFGCGSPDTLLLIPFRDFEPWIDGMNMTHRDDREYWHVHIHHDGERFTLHRGGGTERIELTQFLL